MKIRMKGFALPATLFLSGIFAVSCHDDLDMPGTDPGLSNGVGHIITSFSLDASHFRVGEDVDSVRIALISRSGASQCFGAGVLHEAGAVRFNMAVPDTTVIADGSYILTMRNAVGGSIQGRLSATFKSHILSSVSIILPSYMLDGEGTEENPYLIQNDDDFSMFLINLADDEESYGAGLKFLQTADVNAPDQSTLIPGRGYWGAPFAGIYDGGGHHIRNLYYRGAGRDGSDSRIGLFNTLLGTATVEHLNMSSVAVSGIYNMTGAVAGTVSGDVLLSDISVSGYLEDGYAMGGLIGNVASGTLTVDNVRLSVGIRGTNDIGGIVGRLDNGAALKVNGVTTPDTHFYVEGKSSVGGIVGRSIGICNIYNVTLSHKVSGEDSDVRTIKGSGEGIGGIIGTVTSDAHTQTLRHCHVQCPVGGDGSNVGGIVGQATHGNPLRMDDCRMYSVVSGRRCVGGIIGKADFRNGYGMEIEGEDYATRVAADDADAKVSGYENTGGFAGWWSGKLTLKSKVKINVPVSGDISTGSAFGSVINSTIEIPGFLFGQTVSGSGSTLRVNGSDKTGGVAGTIDGSTLKGGIKFSLSESAASCVVPQSGCFSPDFDCVVSGRTCTGGIVGYSKNSSITNICSAAAVTGSAYVGGLVGNVVDTNGKTRIEDVVFFGRLNCAVAEDVGGIAGYFDCQYGGTITDCINYSAINGRVNTGGLFGRIYKKYPDNKPDALLNVSWCVNMGEIYGLTHIGGIIANHDVPYEKAKGGTVDDEANFFVQNCMNSGRITGDSSSGGSGGIGGIIGFSGAFIDLRYCTNHGDILGKGPFHGIGGIAGSIGSDPPDALIFTGYRNLEVRECLNTATVDADNSSSYVGGVIGYQEEGKKSDVSDCQNIGPVPCKLSHDSGGVIGCVDHLTNIYRCINRGMVSHGNALIGTHKAGSIFSHGELYYLEGTGKGWPSAVMIDEIEFSNVCAFQWFDFAHVWDNNDDGPYLRRVPWRDYKVR
ncbi:MAG: hypothetical protein K2N88_00350 [Muribaculaceae bacterium]|nr:hypothetical protein [Muribaculaceae bacterium]